MGRTPLSLGGSAGILSILALLLLVGSTLIATTAGGGAAENQCVACHTDAGKLKALTPPDPPLEEEGEG